jgi:FAD:protein FMN transferase
MPGIKIRFSAMAGPCELVLEGQQSEDELRSIANEAISEVKRIEIKFSRYDPTSIVSRINSNSGTKPTPIDDETLQLFNFAHQLFVSSQGMFDITSGVLREVWSFKEKTIPNSNELAKKLALIGWNQVELGQNTVLLKQKGMQIDFGGFGKEYASDRAAAVMKTKGIKHGYINLSGDIFVLGPKSSGEAWVMGIQDPRKENAIFASIPIHQGALATSGDYERFFEVGGQRFCHILNPKTGMPVNEWQSISVLAPLTTAAGSASTIAMLLGAQAIPYLKDTGFSYLAIDSKGEVFRN